ncbi:MAG: hypothetical protein IJI47_01445, partial [Eubacterium sp.]|nr:hypothetical protein [Eubacterium sp.]
MEKNKLRILLICLTRRGGLLHFNDCLAEGLNRICDVRLLCGENAEHAEGALQGVSIETLNTGKGAKGTILKLFSPQTWRDLRRIADEFQPDVVHVTSAQEWNPALIASFILLDALSLPRISMAKDVLKVATAVAV